MHEIIFFQSKKKKTGARVYLDCSIYICMYIHIYICSTYLLGTPDFGVRAFGVICVRLRQVTTIITDTSNDDPI